MNPIFAQKKNTLSQSGKNLTTTKSPEAKTAVDKLKKNPKSKSKKEEVIVYNPDFEKGEELFQLNRPEKAIPYFEKAIGAEKVDPKVYIYLGICYYQIGDYNKSLAVCAQGLAREDTDHKILAYNAGNSCYAMGNYMRADASYAISLKEDENYSPAVLNRANAQLKLDHLGDARDNYIRYLEIEPHTPQREKIEELIRLLEMEIQRRAKEKPELINPDSFIENEKMEIPDEPEKVILELPEEIPDDEDNSELVRDDAVAPKIPENQLEIVVSSVIAAEDLKLPDLPVPVVPEKETGEKIHENAPDIPVKEEVVLEEKPKDNAEKVYSPESELPPEEKKEPEKVPSEKVNASENVLPPVEEKVTGDKVKGEKIRLSEDEERFAKEEKERKAEEERKIREAEQARIAAEEEEKRKAEEEEARKAEEKRRAEEEAVRRAEEEKHRAEVASWPSPKANLTVEGGINFTPDGDGRNDSVKLIPSVKYLEDEPEEWTLTIYDPHDNLFRTIKGSGKLPESIEWDGRSDKGELVLSKNTYTAKLSVLPAAKDRQRVGNKTLETEEKIKTGLMLQVIIPGKEWKMVVNTISFDPDAATSKTLTNDQILSNFETLDEVAEQLKENPEATIIVVEGYANNISGTEKENIEELMPLSQKRAEAIVEELVKRGVPREILKADGKGGANPMADRSDPANWYKNRRVEFKIKK